MGGGEPASGLRQHGERVAPAHRAPRHPRPQGLPLDVLHRDVHLIADGAHVVHDDDVRVHQLRDRLALAQETRARGAQLAAEQLDGEWAIEIGIVRGVDDTHAAAAEHAGHDVAADERPRRERGLDGAAGVRRIAGDGDGERIGVLLLGAQR